MQRRIFGIAAPAILALTSIAGYAQSATTHPDPHATKGKDDGRAGALFRKNCLSCHQAPDVRFAVDRAWLNQVQDTA